MSDFRIYNSDLSATAIETLFTNVPLDLGLLVPDMIVTMYSHAAVSNIGDSFIIDGKIAKISEIN